MFNPQTGDQNSTQQERSYEVCLPHINTKFCFIQNTQRNLLCANSILNIEDTVENATDVGPVFHEHFSLVMETDIIQITLDHIYRCMIV